MWTLLAADMRWKKMPTQDTARKTKQLQSGASAFCLLLLISRSETPPPPPPRPPSSSVLCCSARRPARSSLPLCNSKHKRRGFLGMSAGSLFLLSRECCAPFHREEQNNSLTASWAWQACLCEICFGFFFFLHWFTMMKRFLARFTSKSYLLLGIRGFECLLRVFPLRKQLCNSCLEHILSNRFLPPPLRPLFFSSQ